MDDKPTGQKLKRQAVALSEKAASIAGRAVVAIGDLDGDGKVDGADVSLGLDSAGRVAKSIARAPLTKDVATYAAVGAAIALPLPVVGPAIGAAVGASLGLWRNMTRHETQTAATPDPIAELERLHSLKERSIITETEFEAQKRRLLK